ncbi:MAG: PTS sugar transporter subunit IIC [Brevinema sp.]
MSFSNRFIELGAKVANQRHMNAIKDGMVATLPITLGGSFFLILKFLPIPGWNSVLNFLLGADWAMILSYPVAATFDMIGIIALITISYRLSESYKLNPLSGTIIAFCGYLTLTPTFLMTNIEGLADAVSISNVIQFSFTGSQSLFVIIFVAITSIEIYRFIIQKNLVIKLPDMVPPNVATSFIAIIPTFTVLVTMLIVRIIIAQTPYETVHKLVNDLVQTPLMSLGHSVAGYMSLIAIKELFWSVGIHGPNIMSPILMPIEFFARDENRIAFEAGKELQYIFTTSFRPIFIEAGGSGNTLPLAIMCAFMAKSTQLKTIGKLALIPAIFQINEPLLFGIPIILNPFMIIPFIGSSIVGVFLGWLGMSIGFISKLPGIDVPWTLPAIINPYIASAGDLSVVIWQMVVLVIVACIYYPFFRLLDKGFVKDEMQDVLKQS